MGKHSISGIVSGFNGSMSRDASKIEGMNVIEVVDGQVIDSYYQRQIDELEKLDEMLSVGQAAVNFEVMVA